MNHSYLVCFAIIFIAAGVLFFMNFLYERKVKMKMKKYLLNCSNIEKEVLKSFLQNKNKEFPLTKNSSITLNLVKLNILRKIKDDNTNPLHSFYAINIEIFNLVNKDKTLREIYLFTDHHL
ncbi:MAG: super-infection exclusion protein B [Candidatus Phytoplasma pruni]|uniref:super-infection exclusion protein B n=1 Tax=16SrIII (X-disease group) TaxID=85623 RepID=UPI000381E130|nr:MULTISPECIES: super-infection exclusion protein B [16SrIII (X-disease group)]